ncbi:MAG: response regulator [Patescibacteria group bacterium]|nr:response regulator [Patescibacteria group bacterium]MDE2015404.1 response regulator [Patescibacteria group bacterium]MDE2226981.1 response regulator [Patescibacteria group bacterium]
MQPNGKKLLVVDDDEFLLNIYAAKLQEDGYVVRTANNGEEAWDIVQNGYIPDAVFTGIIMPRMTGFDLIAKMQADTKLAGIPVAISSHRGRDEDKKKAKEMKVDDFIIQGTVPLVEVVRRINSLVGIQQRNYKIQLVRGKLDSEALIDFMNKQQQTFFAFETNKNAYLEFEPDAEAGKFKIKLTSD